MERLDRTHSNDTVLNRIQDKIIRALNAVVSKPIINGQLIEQVLVDYAAPTLVPHKLNRKPRGWFVVHPGLPSQANANPIDAAVADEKFLYLQADSATDSFFGNLWVF